MQTAKSGRKYRKVPEGYDVEQWDSMTPIERMRALGLLICIICDKCRVVCDKYYTVKGKKRILHYCEECIKTTIKA
jgi:Na+-translocating ferredoxin:NAD+ oxidoreductase RnfC subunit